jgi:RHH-type proline utilization regulon transcriptional repressor/proline dehydrogenase/delta 1-pyrroline-5-carboxylate dehydrogenase
MSTKENTSLDPDLLEENTQKIGKQIFALMGEESPSWETQVLDWCLTNEELKFQILRFIDLLPTLTTPKEVAKHLREYFPHPDQRLPRSLRTGIALAKPVLLTSRIVSTTTRWLVTRMGYKFIAGATIEEAEKAILSLEKKQMSYTLDILGEAITSEKEADLYLYSYLQLMEEVASKNLTNQVNISLKLSSLYSQFDPIAPEVTAAVVKARLRKILQVAKRLGAFVNVDLEQYEYKELTLDIFKELLTEEGFREYIRVGTVVQAYLRDSDNTLKEMIAWAKQRGSRIQIRLVKGAYWDYEVILAQQRGWPVPVFTQKWETDANFEKLTEILLENHPYINTAIASHNVRSIAHAIAVAQALDVPPNRIEFQMLYGMADDLKEALIKLGQKLRVYTPYGELIPGMAYLVRRILENTSNESFIRHRITQDTSIEDLIRNPRIKKDQVVSEEKIREETIKGELGTVFKNCPLLDFSREENRQNLKHALETVRKQFAKNYPLIIHNRIVQTKDTFPSINPAQPQEVIGMVAKAEISQAEQAIKAAQQAFRQWRRVPYNQRAEYLRKAATLMSHRRMELIAWQVYEVGKNWREADADVAEAIDYLEFYAQEMLRLGPYRLLYPVPGERNEYLYQARGVGAIIAPWNFPLAILTGMTAAAIVTGNTVVMKPAEQSSVIAAKLMEIFLEIGLPSGVVNYLPGKGEEVGAYLVQSPNIDFIAFTGSREVGLHINQIAAQTQKGAGSIKRVIAEMGGKNAIIIDTSADLDEAVWGTVHSAFGYQGQKCSAASRVIVLEAVYHKFLPRLIESTRSIKVGLPEEPDTMIGPLIDKEAWDRVQNYIEVGKKEAKLALEIDISGISDGGYFVGPTVFTEVSPEAVIAQEEIFGPVLAVIKAKDFAEALSIANNVAYGLTGGVYSRTPSHIEQARHTLQVGNLYINRKITGAIVGRQPFGGFKMSGIGSKAGGPDYLLQFMQPQTITENTMRHGFAPLEPEPLP